MKVSERRCALCGQPQSQAKGGIGAFRLALSFLQCMGVPLKLPTSEYAHVSCITKANAKMKHHTNHPRT